MKVTYIDHSSFLIESDNVALLFDYTSGTIPGYNNKALYVFCSHHHSDHYSQAIYNLPAANYYLSSDITEFSQYKDNLTLIKAGDRFESDYFKFQVFPSTDYGVSIKLEMEGKTLYYAGDNGAWRFELTDVPLVDKYTKILREVGKVDAAFIPMDPRLKEYAFLSAEIASKELNPQVIIPMHMWGEYDLIDQALDKIQNTEIVDIREKTFTL